MINFTALHLTARWAADQEFLDLHTQGIIFFTAMFCARLTYMKLYQNTVLNEILRFHLLQGVIYQL